MIPPPSNRIISLEPLNGLRFFAFLPIFFLHATGNRDLWLNPTLFALDFFFILAGYMAAVGRYGEVPGGIADLANYSFTYVKKKINHFYPLYLTAFLLIALLLCLAPQFAGYAPDNAFDGGWKAGINLLLLQAWSWDRTVKFSYNGVSWFLSTLMFCFLLTPLLLRMLECVALRFGNKFVLVVAIITALIKLPLYILDTDMTLSADVTEIFYFDAHSWPPFRLADYSVGLCAGAWWKMVYAARKPGRYTGMRSYFMMAICVPAMIGYDWLPQPIVLVALAGGIYGVSTYGGNLIRLLQSRGLIFLGSLVMPVYLMHNVVLKYARWADVDISQNSVALVLLWFCFCLAYVWQRVEKIARAVFRQIS